MIINGSSVPISCFAARPFIITQAYLSSTSRLVKGSHQAADGDQPHGNFTPGRFSVGCPHCLRRLCAGKHYHARTVAGQEYHCPHCRLSPCRVPPDIFGQPFFAPQRARNQSDQKSNQMTSCCSARYIVARRHSGSRQWECT